MKIGLLGGTFNPVHNGHLALASSASQHCTLNKTVLLPAAQPPHKQGEEICPFHHRHAMLCLVAEENKGLEVSALEQSLPLPSYTIDTIRYLQGRGHPATEYYFITGADAFADICSWKDYRELLSRVHFVVFSRTGLSTMSLEDLYQSLGYLRHDENLWRDTGSGKKIETFSFTPPNISSSMIRERIRLAKDIRSLVPSAVAQYIEKYHLYT